MWHEVMMSGKLSPAAAQGMRKCEHGLAFAEPAFDGATYHRYLVPNGSAG